VNKHQHLPEDFAHHWPSPLDPSSSLVTFLFSSTKKKIKVDDGDVASGAAAEEETPVRAPVNEASKEIKVDTDENMPVDKFRVSEGTRKILADQGITTLFPIQHRAFDFVYDGTDVIGTPSTSSFAHLTLSYDDKQLGISLNLLCEHTSTPS